MDYDSFSKLLAVFSYLRVFVWIIHSSLSKKQHPTPDYQTLLLQLSNCFDDKPEIASRLHEFYHSEIMSYIIPMLIFQKYLNIPYI